MSSLHQRLTNAHQARRAAWAARGVGDAGIDLKRKADSPPRIIAFLPPMLSNIEAAVVEATATLSRLRRVSICDVQRVVCAEFGIRMEDINGPKRTGALVRPRQLPMYLCRSVLKKSYPEIGRGFGNRDHTTALSAIRKIERLIDSDAVLAGRITRIEADLLARKEAA